MEEETWHAMSYSEKVQQRLKWIGERRLCHFQFVERTGGEILEQARDTRGIPMTVADAQEQLVRMLKATVVGGLGLDKEQDAKYKVAAEVRKWLEEHE